MISAVFFGSLNWSYDTMVSSGGGAAAAALLIEQAAEQVLAADPA